MSPVTLGVEVAQVQARLLAQRDIRRCARDLAGDERPTSPWTLVVEENAVARVHVVRLAVVLRDPETIELSDTIRAAWVERGRLILDRSLDKTVELRSRRLVEARVLLEATRADRVEETEGAEAIDISGILGHLERDLDMRLGTEVVDLCRLNGSNNINKIGTIA